MANDVNYFEIGSSDPEASKAFYGPLFGWEFGEPAMPARYGTVNDNRGGLRDTTEIGADNSAIFYVQVDDVQAVLHRAQELGATVLVPLVDNGAIEFAQIADPLGNRLESGDARSSSSNHPSKPPGQERVGRERAVR